MPRPHSLSLFIYNLSQFQEFKEGLSMGELVRKFHEFIWVKDNRSICLTFCTVAHKDGTKNEYQRESVSQLIDIDVSGQCCVISTGWGVVEP